MRPNFVTEALLLALIVHDLRTHAPRAPYLVLLALTVFQQAAFVVLPGATWWTRACAWIASP